jgi:hypothetical protein
VRAASPRPTRGPAGGGAGAGNLRATVSLDPEPAEAGAHRLPREKAAVTVARRIVASIERERLAPGDKLPPERAMQEQYGVGGLNRR